MYNPTIYGYTGKKYQNTFLLGKNMLKMFLACFSPVIQFINIFLVNEKGNIIYKRSENYIQMFSTRNTFKDVVKRFQTEVKDLKLNDSFYCIFYRKLG